MSSVKNAYSMSPNMGGQRKTHDSNFGSDELKTQYLTHGLGGTFDKTSEKRISRKPPMHK